jgi:amino-acid N-acetyltransferase
VTDRQDWTASAPFSEKGFYLHEFRGRTLGFAVPPADLAAPEPLTRVLADLATNRTRAIVLSTDAHALEGALGAPVLSIDEPRFEGAVWRALVKVSRVGVAVGSRHTLASACREVALRLRLGKLVWIDPDGGLQSEAARLSFVDLAELRELLGAPGASLGPRRRALLEAIERLLADGIPAVNLCTLAGVADELFSYAGSGTLFTAERYIEVRPLRLDDFDAAHDLLARGIDEGFLAPRSQEQADAVLAGGFGAFVEGRHLAGIGALLIDAADGSGEIAALYALTRFTGEGVGSHLVRFALARAAERDVSTLYACTISERVGAFFERQGFEVVAADALPARRFEGYDAARRAKLRCYRRSVGS